MENYTAQLNNNFTSTKSAGNVKSGFITKVVFGTLGIFMAYHTLISLTGLF